MIPNDEDDIPEIEMNNPMKYTVPTQIIGKTVAKVDIHTDLDLQLQHLRIKFTDKTMLTIPLQDKEYIL